MSKETLLANHLVKALQAEVSETTLKACIKNREKLDDESLSACLESAAGFAFYTLKMCEPLIKEMQKRFRKNNGKHAIAGCHSFQEWCNKMLHRTEQAVYLMLRKSASSSETSKKNKTEKPIKELQALADAIPAIRNGKGYVKPADYGVADINDTIHKFSENLVRQLRDPRDQATVYRSLIAVFQELLACSEREIR